jgi:hypothetical protein
VGNPLLILAGIPRGIYLRQKDFSPQADGWDIVTVVSRSEHADVSKSWTTVVHTADEASDGAHIFAFHSLEQDRPRFNRTISSRHRLIWLDKTLLAEYGQPNFNYTLQRLVDFEMQWRNLVRPNSVGEPLVLPEPSFSTEGKYKGVWHRAQWVTTTSDTLTVVGELVSSFQSHYGKAGKWIDERELVFSFTGPRHALAQRQ